VGQRHALPLEFGHFDSSSHPTGGEDRRRYVTLAILSPALAWSGAMRCH